MIFSQISGLRLPCVPVSTAEMPESKVEKKQDLFGHDLKGPHIYELADAFNTLIDAGYKLGCDGELLPPKCFEGRFQGADA